MALNKFNPFLSMKFNTFLLLILSEIIFQFINSFFQNTCQLPTFLDRRYVNKLYFPLCIGRIFIFSLIKRTSPYNAVEWYVIFLEKNCQKSIRCPNKFQIISVVSVTYCCPVALKTTCLIFSFSTWTYWRIQYSIISAKQKVIFLDENNWMAWRSKFAWFAQTFRAA